MRKWEKKKNKANRRISNNEYRIIPTSEFICPLHSFFCHLSPGSWLLQAASQTLGKRYDDGSPDIYSVSLFLLIRIPKSEIRNRKSLSSVFCLLPPSIPSSQHPIFPTSQPPSLPASQLPSIPASFIPCKPPPRAPSSWQF